MDAERCVMCGRIIPEGYQVCWICEEEIMNKEPKKCCGTCKWHEYEHIDDSWVCVNANSYYCTDWTDYDFCCEDWEGRNT